MDIASSSWAERNPQKTPATPHKKSVGQHIHHSVEASRAFGEALEAMMMKWGYDPTDAEDRVAFGEHLQKEITPPRHFAIDPCVIEAWLKGELLPGLEVLNAATKMSRESGDKALEEMLDACDDTSGLRRPAVAAAFGEIAGLLGMQRWSVQENTPSLSRLLVSENHGPDSIKQMLSGRNPMPPEVGEQLRSVIDAKLAAQPRRHAEATEKLTQLLEHQAAHLNVGSATEFSTLLAYCFEQGGKSSPKIAALLFSEVYGRIGSGAGTQGAVRGAEKSLSRPTFTAWAQGRSLPSPEAVAALAGIFRHVPAVAAQAQLLAPSYDEARQQVAARLWQQAAEDNQPGLYLQACRERYGAPLKTYSEDYGSHVAWHHYEQDAKRHGKAKIGIPCDPEKRAAILAHTLKATARAGEAYAALLQLPPRPWLLADRSIDVSGRTPLSAEEQIERLEGLTPALTGRPGNTAMPMTPGDRTLAQERVQTLQEKIVANTLFNEDRRAQNSGRRKNSTAPAR